MVVLWRHTHSQLTYRTTLGTLYSLHSTLCTLCTHYTLHSPSEPSLCAAVSPQQPNLGIYKNFAIKSRHIPCFNDPIYVIRKGFVKEHQMLRPMFLKKEGAVSLLVGITLMIHAWVDTSFFFFFPLNHRFGGGRWN